MNYIKVPYTYFCSKYRSSWASWVVLAVKNSPGNAGDIRDAGLIPGWGRSPGVDNGNSLQYSCLENPMDREVWRATVHRATSQTWLSDWRCTHTELKAVGCSPHELCLLPRDPPKGVCCDHKTHRSQWEVPAPRMLHPPSWGECPGAVGRPRVRHPALWMALQVPAALWAG